MRGPLVAGSILSLGLPLAAVQPITAPNTPHRGSFPVVEVVTSDGAARARPDPSPAIVVPRNAPLASERPAPPEQDVRQGPPPWRLDTGAYIEHAYPIRQRFDGWSYGVYWNTVTRRWERGWHTTRFGLDPDYYR